MNNNIENYLNQVETEAATGSVLEKKVLLKNSHGSSCGRVFVNKVGGWPLQLC